MKKTVCFIVVLSVLALVLCGCGFNYDKEDLSKYVELANYKNFTYADFEKRYEEYRKNYAEEIKSGESSFVVEDGFAVDISVTAEIVTEEKSEDGATTTVSYKRYENWCFDGDDKCIKDYCVGKTVANEKFDGGIHYNVKDVSDSYESEREVSIDKAFSFTMTIPLSYEDDDVAGRSVRFTITVLDVLPGTTDDDIYSEISAFFEKCGYKKDKAENGDWIVFDFKGTIDGKEFNGGSGEDYKIRIGGGYLFESFEEGLKGHGAGDKFTMKVTFPSSYDDSTIAGKEAEFAITVKEVYNTDETVKQNTDFADYYELKNALRVIHYMKNKMMDMIVEKSSVKEYPKTLMTQYEKYFEDEVATTVSEAASKYSISEDEAKKRLYGSAAAADEYIKSSAEASAKEALITHAVKKSLGIEYTNKNYKDDLANLQAYLLYYGGYNLTTSELEGIYTRDVLKIQFLYQTCNEELCKSSLPKDTPSIPGL